MTNVASQKNTNSLTLLEPIYSFLKCSTPEKWIEKAKNPENLPILLTDHLYCELKAAQTAMLLIRRYAVDDCSGKALLEWLKPFEDFAYRNIGEWESLDKLKLNKSMVSKSDSAYSQELIDKMILLIREELHHFYQVLEIMNDYGIELKSIASSRYAKGLLKHTKTHDPESLVDKLICGAYIEARSCERFAKIAPFLDKDLSEFYFSLIRSEARHFEDYLSLARSISSNNIEERIEFFGQLEAKLIMEPDSDFKFHSGEPS